jgi:hypothetical protein
MQKPYKMILVEQKIEEKQIKPDSPIYKEAKPTAQKRNALDCMKLIAKEVKDIAQQVTENAKSLNKLLLSVEGELYFEDKLELTTLNGLRNLLLNSHFYSKILTFWQSYELLSLGNLSFDSEWKLIYRASEHGFTIGNFLSRCQNTGSTLVLIRTVNGCVFGGYTEAKWSGDREFKSDEKAFIFSLTNKHNKPVKMRIKDHADAICCVVGASPSYFKFGKSDIHISDNSNAASASTSSVSVTFKHPEYAQGSAEAQTLLAGANTFQVSEIEVFEQD